MISAYGVQPICTQITPHACVCLRTPQCSPHMSRRSGILEKVLVKIFSENQPENMPDISSAYKTEPLEPERFKFVKMLLLAGADPNTCVQHDQESDPCKPILVYMLQNHQKLKSHFHSISQYNRRI